MLKLIYLACLTLLACTTEGHAKFSKIEKHKLQIKALHSEYRSEESFHGIIEAFKHRESTAGRLFVRSDPQRRDGLYFVVSFRSAIRLIPANSKITIHFITDSNHTVLRPYRWTQRRHKGHLLASDFIRCQQHSVK